MLGFGPPQGMQGARPMGPATALKPGVPVPSADGVGYSNRQDRSVPVLGDSFADQINVGDQNSAKVSPETTNENKVFFFKILIQCFL